MLVRNLLQHRRHVVTISGQVSSQMARLQSQPMLPLRVSNAAYFSTVKSLRAQQLNNKETTDAKDAKEKADDAHNGTVTVEHDGHTHTHNPNEEIYGDLTDHDHIHLKESETEKNDSYTFGKVHQQKHSHANDLLVWDKDQFWKNPGVRITWIGLIVNVGMAAGKLVGGIAFHSQALMADSVHAISDLFSDFLTLGTVGLAARGPTEQFPYGYGKIETVGSLAVSSILTMAGLSIGWASLTNIVGPMVPTALIETLNAYHIHLFSGHGHSHTHGAADLTNINAAWIAAASIVAKEWVFRATSKVAKEQNSKVLLANAWHHRVDSLTSLVAFVTITGGYFFNIGMLDSVGGLIVSGLVIKAGFNGIALATNELVDRSIPKADQRYVEVHDKMKGLLDQMLSNNNAGKPYRIQELVLLTSGPNVNARCILEAPLQRWDNVLDINEFEIVSQHLKKQLMKDVDNLRNVEIEFVGEKAEEEEEEGDNQLTELNTGEEEEAPKKQKDPAELLHSHSHGHTHHH